jgi:hypothetical protein
MPTRSADSRRRRIIQFIAAGAVVAPFGSAVLAATAGAADTIKESDPAAVALKYKADASKAADRKDPAAFCDNCTFYTGKPGSADGACAALAGGLVAAKGWCTAWEGY